MKFEKKEHCFIISTEFKELKQSYLLISDVHIDSKNCDKKLLKSHLEQAKERDAKVFIFGDLFDAMQSRNDKRSDKNLMKDSDLQGAYFNQIIDEAYNFLEPYKEQILFITYGNHETTVMKYSEIDLIRLLANQLNSYIGNYEGYIKFNFKETTGHRTSKLLYYHHGAGGSSPMTKGILNHGRASMFVDADIIVSGHNHEAWTYEQMRMKCTLQGEVKVEKQTHVKTPTYAKENIGFGFLTEKWNAPKPVGGWWLNFSNKSHEVNYYIERTDNG